MSARQICNFSVKQRKEPLVTLLLPGASHHAAATSSPSSDGGVSIVETKATADSLASESKRVGGEVKPQAGQGGTVSQTSPREPLESATISKWTRFRTIRLRFYPWTDTHSDPLRVYLHAVPGVVAAGYEKVDQEEKIVIFEITTRRAYCPWKSLLTAFRNLVADWTFLVDIIRPLDVSRTPPFSLLSLDDAITKEWPIDTSLSSSSSSPSFVTSSASKSEGTSLPRSPSSLSLSSSSSEFPTSPHSSVSSSSSSSSRVPLLQFSLAPFEDLECDYRFQETVRKDPTRNCVFFLKTDRDQPHAADCLTSLCNGWRRMMSEVPVLKLTRIVSRDVRLSTVVNHEEIARNLGQLPWCSDQADDVLHRSQCDCVMIGDDGPCGECTVRYRLCVHNESDAIRKVTTADLVLDTEHTEYREWHKLYWVVTRSPGAPIPICLLAPGDAIDFTCWLQKENALTMPIAEFVRSWAQRSVEEIRIADEFQSSVSANHRKVIAGHCRSNVFDIEDVDGACRLTVAAPLACSDCGECLRIMRLPSWDADSLISKRPRTDYYEVRLCTNGALTPLGALHRAAQHAANVFARYLSVISAYHQKQSL